MEQVSFQLLEGVTVTPLFKHFGKAGNVMHVLKQNDAAFDMFGEIYFSTIKSGNIKGWKKHTKMISNLVVPVGKVQFVFYDDRLNSSTFQQFKNIELSIDNYCRLTIVPGIWMAFKGLSNEESLILNCSSIEHDPNECLEESIETCLQVPAYFK
jgi:dTDP-4-dehydrorhamnose 3,5-epimerase